MNANMVCMRDFAASAELPPFVAAYDSSFGQPLEEFFQHSAKIGGDVKAQADIVKAAYDAQRQFLVKVARCKKPSDVSRIAMHCHVEN